MASAPGERPVYHSDTNTWDGISDRDWRQLQRRLDAEIRDGASFNLDLSGRDYREEAAYQVMGDWVIRNYTPAQRFKSAIETLQNGLITVTDMHQMLDEMERVAQDYANGDPWRGRARWESRDPNLPDEFYFYHWSF